MSQAITRPPAAAPDEGEVTYRRGEDGTHADLVLILSDAFALAPFFNQVAQAMPGGAAVPR